MVLIDERTGSRANAQSVLSMVSADVKQGDPCRIEVDGDDAQAALAAITRFVKSDLPHCDAALPQLTPAAVELALPRSLLATGLKKFVRGRAVSGGVAFGRAVVIGKLVIPSSLADERATDPVYERQRVSDARESVGAALEFRITQSKQTQEIEVLKAHAAIVRDVALSESIYSLIVDKQRTAGQAIVEACETFAQALGQSQSVYLQERVLDVEDICSQLLDQVQGVSKGRTGPTLSAPSICVAERLTPGQLLALDRKYLKGLVLIEGGTTSHTVILARAMNLPTLVGATHALGACAKVSKWWSTVNRVCW